MCNFANFPLTTQRINIYLRVFDKIDLLGKVVLQLLYNSEETQTASTKLAPYFMVLLLQSLCKY